MHQDQKESHASQQPQKELAHFAQNPPHVPRNRTDVAITPRRSGGRHRRIRPRQRELPRHESSARGASPAARLGEAVVVWGSDLEGGYRYVLASPAEVGVYGEGRSRADLPPAAAEGVGVGILAVRVPADRTPVHRWLGPHQIQELLWRRLRRTGGGPRRLQLRRRWRRRLRLDRVRRLHGDGGRADRGRRSGGRRLRRSRRLRRRRRHGRAPNRTLCRRRPRDAVGGGVLGRRGNRGGAGGTEGTGRAGGRREEEGRLLKRTPEKHRRSGCCLPLRVHRRCASVSVSPPSEHD
jgi:hypothetical protein